LEKGKMKWEREQRENVNNAVRKMKKVKIERKVKKCK
jgi:hypothetical protein